MRINPFSFTSFFRFAIFPFLSQFLNPSVAWAPIIASVAGSVIGGLLSKKGADNAASAMEEQNRIAREQLQMAREQWGRFKKLYGPLEESIIEEVDRPADVEGARGRASNDVIQAFTKARGITKRNMARLGINPNSGAFAAALGRQDIEMAKADASARYAAGIDERDRVLNRKMAAVQLGRGLPVAAMAGFNSASRAMGNLANAYGRSAASMARFGYNMGSNLGSAIYNAWNSGGTAAGYSGGGTYTPFSGGWNQASSNFMNADFDSINAGSTNFADGGEVVGPGTETSDSVPINASNGEFVIPADVVKKKGTEFFEKLISKYHVPARGLPAPIAGPGIAPAPSMPGMAQMPVGPGGVNAIAPGLPSPAGSGLPVKINGG